MLDIVVRRRSVRKYLEREIPPSVLEEVLRAAMYAPTAKNLRPTEFVIVKQAETKAAFARATPYASFAKEAPAVLAVCYDTSRGNRFKEDCAIAAENIYLEATNQGLGACYIQIAEGTQADAGEPEQYVKELLGIPERVRVLCLMTLGYPVKMPPPHGEEEYDRRRVHTERY